MNYTKVMMTAGVLILLTGSAFAKDICQDQYKSDVHACTVQLHALNPSLRSGVQQSCVTIAQAHRSACEQPNTCNGQCEQAYGDELRTCDVRFDPSGCPTQECVTASEANRAACTDGVAANFDACVAACAP